jgi:heme exporter protein D
MYVELLIMNGYGQFVWPAFIFSFACCFYLYEKTRFELKQQERIFFLEYREAQAKKIEFVKGKQSTQEALSIN